jgi:hypothetical protein
MKSIFQSAQDNWPEDEASLQVDSFNGRKADGYTDEENFALLAKDCARMRRFFERESDAADLIARFDCKVLELLLLPYVQAKVPACVALGVKGCGGSDSWVNAYTDPLKKGFQVVYLCELLPRNLWPHLMPGYVPVS